MLERRDKKGKQPSGRSSATIALLVTTCNPRGRVRKLCNAASHRATHFVVQVMFESHDSALCAAPGVLILVVHAHLSIGLATVCARASSSADRVAVVFADLSNNVVEGVLDVNARLGRSLDELAAEVAGEFLASCQREIS